MNLLTAEHLKKSYTERLLFDDVAFSIGEGDKIGLIGINGTGKSTFIKILMGQVKPDSGTVDIGETVRFGYYSQDGLQFDEQMKVIDVIQDIAEVIELGNGKKLTASQFLQHFLFTPETQHSYVYKLSGGERRRLYLCTILMRNPNFLVLDEPTNDLDIITLNVLEEYLQNFKGCVIVVSHDRYFINRVATKVMEISEDGATIYLGDYDYYLEKKAELEELARLEAEENQVSEEVQVASAGASDYQAQKANQKEMRKLSRRIEQIENELETIEERLEEISAAMLETNDVAELSDLQKELDDLTDSQEALMEEWSDLSEQLEG